MHLDPIHSLGRFASCLALCAMALSGCTSGDAGNSTESSNFTLRSTTPNLVLIEGDDSGLTIPLALERRNGHSASVSLSLQGKTDDDVAFVTNSFDRLEIGPDANSAQATLRLAIADRPILPQTRDFIVVATDGESTSRTEVRVDVEPVDAPDVYLLVGQSNMVGSSGDGTRRAGPGQEDELNSRVLQLNVIRNDPFEIFANNAAYTSPEINFPGQTIVTAEDPLHVEADPERESGKGFEYIGLGLSFGKTALADTSRNVVLVPAAWSGSAFCDNEGGPRGQWNSRPTSVAVLGNTLLFDRALLRIDRALAETGGILRGILWHQGESDANLPCAERYADNLAQLANDFRTRIAPDRRGSALRVADAPIPFVVGTMSRGIDERGDYSEFNSAKEMIDQDHRRVGNLIPHAAVSVHDDLIPTNGYACGQGDCIHFGPQALREMGRRYYRALSDALSP